jgi:flagellar basal body-associated protein FliL
MPAPPDYGAPAPPAPRRGRGPLVAIVLIVLLVILVGGGYVVGGFVYANGKVNSATDAYNKVVDHENALTDLFNKLDAQFKSNNGNTTTQSSDSIKQDKALNLQLASSSKTAQPTVQADDQTLANAASSLNENSWLTALSKSSLDKSANRISHARAALAVAETILADSILYGTFYATVDDAALDLDALDTAANAGDLNAVDTAIQTLKTDVAKAIQEDSAPGVASQMDPFLKDLQKTANDFSTLVAAVRAGDSAGVNRAVAALDADTTKLNSYDFAAMGTSEQTYYKALIDKYNAEIDAANKA